MDRNSVKMQDLMKLANKGGNDATLILLDKLHDLEDRLDELKKEPPEDQKVERVAMRLASKLSIMEKGEKGDKGDKGEKGKDGKDGRDGVDGIDGKDGVDGKDGAMGVVDEATIAYLEDIITKVEGEIKLLKQTPQTRTGWGAHPLVIQNASGTVVDKVARNIKFAGSAVASVVRGADGVVTVTLNSGAGGTLNSEVPTGTVNDTNMTFTVANTPAYIVVNGLAYQAGEGIFTSYSTPTITLNTPVGSGGFIRSYY